MDATLAQLVELMPDALLVVDEAGTVLLSNAGAQSLLGLSRDALTGMNIDSFVPAARRAQHRLDCQTFIAEGRARAMGGLRTLPLLRPDGTQLFVEISQGFMSLQGKKVVSVAIRDKSELARARADADASENKLRDLFDSAPDSILTADPQGRFQEVNHALCQLLGYERDELLRLRITDLLPLTEQGKRTAIRASHPAQPVMMEFQVRHRDGQIIPVEAFGKLSPSGVSTVILRDLRPRRQVEAQVRLQASLLSHVHDAVVALDEQRRIYYWNPGAQQLFGWNNEEALGRSDLLQISVESEGESKATAAGLAALLSQVTQTDVTRLTVRILTKNGDTRYCDLTLSRLPAEPASTGSQSVTAGGDRGGYIACFHDITAKRLTEERLAQKQAALRQLHNVSGQLIGRDALPALLTAVTAAAMGVARAPAGMLHVYHPDTHNMQRVAQLQLPDGLLPPDCVLQNPQTPWCHAGNSLQRVCVPDLDAPTQISADICARLRSAGLRAVLSIPLLARDGGLLGVVSVLWTTPHQVSETSLQLLDLLAREAADLIEFRRREERLRDAIRARDDMLGVVAHDLRNPVNSILLQAQLLKRRAEPRSQQCAAAIVKDSHRMNRLIEDLLDVARLDAGTFSMQLGPVDVAGAIHEAVETAQLTDAAAGHTIESQPLIDVPAVWADADRLRQILDNLLGNALKFTPEGGVVHVSASPRENAVCFCVRDTGSGIAPDQLPHVFDRFWQASQRDRRGAGLGLAIVHGIVRAHGGQIWVESELGRGSSFFFTLPTTRPS